MIMVDDCFYDVGIDLWYNLGVELIVLDWWSCEALVESYQRGE